MDTYQAIYDAVRSKISGGDVGEAVRDAVSRAFDISYAVPIIQQEFCIAAAEMARPSTVHRPKVFPDGNQWCALYGDDLMMGVCGFGDTPDLACHAFDKAWHEKIPPLPTTR